MILRKRRRLINELREILQQYTDENISLKNKFSNEIRKNNERVRNYEANIEVLNNSLLEIKKICEKSKKSSKIAKEILKLIPIKGE